MSDNQRSWSSSRNENSDSQVSSHPNPNLPYPMGIFPMKTHGNTRTGNLRIHVPFNNRRGSEDAIDTEALLGSAISTSSSINSKYSQDSKLEDPIRMSPSQSKEYEQITQLPTPVLNGGLFAGTRLDIPKNSKSQKVKSGSAHRAISEFIPGEYRNRSQTLATTAPLSQTRHISNPLQTEDHPNTIPLPPLEPEQSSFVGQIFEAPLLQEKFVGDKTIGKGTFSTVVQAHDILDPAQLCAIKIVEVPLEQVSNFRLYICRELGFLTHLKHPCVIELLDYSVNLSITQDEIDQAVSGSQPQDAPAGSEMYDTYSLKLQNKQLFFLKYCRGGNLFDWLYQHHKAQERQIQFWRLLKRLVAELLVSVAYIHSENVIHRDIKLENVLLNFDDTTIPKDVGPHELPSPLCTLTDFGLSKKLSSPDQLLETKCGSQDYVSPELLMGLQYDGKLLDSWSLGVLIYAILENRLPFDAPPLEYLSSSNLSPSVLKRRRNRHNPAHRIAMIDWEWFRITAVMKDDTYSDEAKTIMKELCAVVEKFLVRKDKRTPVGELIKQKEFEWILQAVPQNFYDLSI